jgi:hypothetical protein
MLHVKHPHVSAPCLLHAVPRLRLQVSLKALAATAELPMLERLEVRTRKG